MRNRDKERKLFVELIDYQLAEHGVSYEDVKDNPNWYMEYQTTSEKEEEFISYIIERVQSELGLTEDLAKKEAHWFILQWGLTIPKSSEKSTKKSTKKEISSKNK
jgi:hypothetical protein